MYKRTITENGNFFQLHGYCIFENKFAAKGYYTSLKLLLFYDHWFTLKYVSYLNNLEIKTVLCTKLFFLCSKILFIGNIIQIFTKIQGMQLAVAENVLYVM